MKTSMTLRSTVLASALLLISGAWAAESPKLVAPLYQGAVPAFPAAGVKNAPRSPASFGGLQALDCRGLDPSRGFDGKVLTPTQAAASGNDRSWCFLTRDPIDKVKAFYEKSLGAMQAFKGASGQTPAQAYAAYVETAITKSGGETGPTYRGISLHALAPLPPRGKEAKNTDDSWAGQEAYQFYAGLRHFSGFLEGVDWFNGEPGKRKPAELDALYKKRSRVESAFFQRKGQKSEAVDATLSARYSKKQNELKQAAFGTMMPSQAQIQQMQQAANTARPANEDATPEDARFNAFMKKNPQAARRYTELTKKLGTLMQAGKFDEADAVDEELEKLVESHPELAALERQEDERSAAASAAGQAQENQAMAAQGKKMDQAIWGTWLEYLNAVEKEAYYTLIVIDEALRGDEKSYSRDRAPLAKGTASLGPHGVLGMRYDAVAQAASQRTAQPQSQPAAQPEQPSQPQDEIKDAAKKGWKALKKLF